jgi:peptidoglycan hydrolase-like protein with peptidoglycan-binding domain
MKKNIITLVALFSLVIPFGVTAQQSDEESSTDSCLLLSTPLLRYRMRDATTSGEVSDLQDFLITKGFLSGDSTGYYGLKTVEAVKKYQASKGVIRTGSVGNLTKTQIKNDTCGDGVDTTSGAQGAGGSSSQSGSTGQVKQTPVVVQQTPTVNTNTQNVVSRPVTVTPTQTTSSVDAYLPALPKAPTELEMPTLTALDNDWISQQSDTVTKNVCWMNNTSSFDSLTLKMWVRGTSGDPTEFFSDMIIRSRPAGSLSKMCAAVRIPLNGKKVFFTLDIANKAGSVRSAPSNEILADILTGETPIVDLPKTIEVSIISTMPGSTADPAISWKASQVDSCELFKGSSLSGVSLFKKNYESHQKYSNNDTFYTLPTSYANTGTEMYTVSCVNNKTKETVEKTTQLTITKY